MMLIDTHTHLYSEDFKEDRAAMMQRALNAGVTKMFVPSIDSSYSAEMYAVAKEYPENVFLMMGLHPTHVKENYSEELAFVEKELASRTFYAVGEIGIDLYWDKTFLKQQQEAFQYQIQLAKKHQLPINIHCRDAFDEVFEILEEEKGESLSGIFHCFTGNKEQAIRAVDCNMKLGVGGVVTFKNGKIDQFLHEIDLKNIVLETDAPYLAPVPYRGKRNESSYIPLIAEKLAHIYTVSPQEVAEVTTQNAKAVFGI
ncbi:TatD family hydrolase [Flavobacterium sp. NRK F10]|uniref:TatD family hydrolase n=1 Tax=Flavobacterium sp. NRK F10 TaxID=2954931 RepID=UPI002090DB58|nr:TatD family hydrolase [Flavobacterium sp. NRK F10]MCO6174959.1 TatD family hydrolase [Flavobacterium sp. NRK F10]